VNANILRNTVTFQKTVDDGETYTDILTARAYINGVSGSEFFIANAGYEAALVVTITCRYQLALMAINPTDTRCVDEHGYIYDLISPADDKQGLHDEVIFRARRRMPDE
jgi:hypothetical protein